MDKLKSTVIGFLAVLVIGIGGGFLLGPLASSGRSEAAVDQPAPFIAMARVLVEEASGEVEVLAPGGMWRRVGAGETLERPTALRTKGPDASITVSHDTVRMTAQHDARVLLGGAGALAVQLDSGRVLVHSRAGQVKVSVPAAQAVATGEAFGVWSRGDVMMAAVLDGSLTIDTASGISTQYTKGREITLLPRGPTPVVMETELKLDVLGIEKSGKGYKVSGRTAPTAIVLARNGARYDTIAVNAGGNFVAEIAERVPGPGDLVAHDAAGRRAEMNKPSQSLDQVLASISKGAPIANTMSAVSGVEKTPEKAPEPTNEVRALATEPAKEPVREPERTIEEVKPENKPAKTAKTEGEAKKPRKAKAESATGGRGHDPKPVELELPGLSGEPKEEAKVEEKKKEQVEEKKEPKKPEKSEEEGAVELEWE